MERTQFIIAAIGLALGGALLPFSQDWAALVVGLTLLVLGADWLVDGSARLAGRLGVSHLLIGLTVVAFGTSAPELGASVQATLKGEGALAIGNVVGSNIANICLILGLTALLRPVTCPPRLVREDVPAMIGVTAVGMLAIGTGGVVGRIEGVVLTLGIIGYTFWLYTRGRREASAGLRGTVAAKLVEAVEQPNDAPPGGKGIWREVVLVVVGAAALGVGSKMLVFGASSVAATMGVSASVIGLTIIAFGTSVPELVTCLNAVLKKESDIATGNILGSNVFNILSVLGVASLVRPIDVPPDVVSRDIWVMLAVALACLPLMRKRVSRAGGGFLFLSYLLYMVYLGLEG